MCRFLVNVVLYGIIPYKTHVYNRDRDNMDSEFLAELLAFSKNHFIIVGGWVFCFGYLIYAQIVVMIDRLKYANFADATNMVNHQNGVFVDIRAHDEFQKGHLAGAVELAVLDIQEAKVARIEKYKSAPVIVVGTRGDDNDTYNCAKALKKAGYLNTFILTGGMLDIQSSNIPLTKK